MDNVVKTGDVKSDLESHLSFLTLPASVEMCCMNFMMFFWQIYPQNSHLSERGTNLRSISKMTCPQFIDHSIN